MPFVASAPASAAPITVPPQVQATSWSTTPMATAGASTSNSASNVSCSLSSFCMAVGAQGAAGATTTLAQKWNGSTWSIVPTADPAGETDSGLTAVSCVGPSFCMAVGSAKNASSDTVTLAESWDGAKWTIVPTVDPSVTTDSLASVSCTTTTFCVAVGASGTPAVPLAEAWTGGASFATQTFAEPPSTTDVALEGITCIGQSFCMTVGHALMSASTVTVSATWNGATWTPQTTPNVSGSTHSELDGVSCAGPSFCQAVGLSIDSSSNEHNLIESWNGSAWTIATAPDNTHAGSVMLNFLSGVDCISATVCTAVGGAGAALTSLQTTVLNWDGTAWSLGTSPNATGAGASSLRSVSCITDWACMAAGNSQTASISQPFGITASIARSGYRFVASDGGIFNFGPGAPSLGSLGNTALNAPIVGMGVMPAGDGYYMVDANGGVFPFGSAQQHGGATNLHLNKPIVGMAVTPDGGGYWLLGGDGGVFSYGDAQFYGSTGNLVLNKPVVGMDATPDGKGYYFVASDGGVFSYGDALFYGSTGNLRLNKPVDGMSVPTGGGYYLVASDGGIFAFPTGPSGIAFFGSAANIALNKPMVGMAAVQGGYYLVASDGGIFAYPTGPGGLAFFGSTGNIVLNKPINGMTA